jgi:hypothetical protein
MAPQKPITVIDPPAWEHSTATMLSLGLLVAGGRWPAGDECGRAARGVDRAVREGPSSQPPFGYVVSFVRFHERGFAALASRFMRGLCYHYSVELHNFTPNAIS